LGIQNLLQGNNGIRKPGKENLEYWNNGMLEN
jgi:hypothetical protein